MKRNQIAWWLWAAGTVLIVLSWLRIAGPGAGWCGFALGALGSVLGWGLRPPQNNPPSLPDAPVTPRKSESDTV